MRTARSWFVLGMALSIIGCGTAVEDASAQDQNIEVWPEAEENLGSVKIVLPANADKPIDEASYQFAQDLTGAPAGAPAMMDLRPGVAQRARKGRGAFFLKSGERTQSLEVDIEPGRTTTIDLSLLSLRYAPTEIRESEMPDFGPRPSVTSSNILFDRRWVNLEPASGLDGSGATYAPVLASVHTYTLATVPNDQRTSKTIDLTTERMQTVTIDRSPGAPPLPAIVRLSFARRALPDAVLTDGCAMPFASRTVVLRGRLAWEGELGERAAGPVHDNPARLCWTGTTLVPYQGYDASVVRALRIDSDSATLRMYPARSGGAYALVVNPLITVPIAFAEGETVPVRIERIDVHDITVTRRDGTTFKERGTYRVEQRSASGIYEAIAAMPMELPTNTGIDVLPGQYRVTTRCTSADCDPTPRTYDLDLR